MLISRDSLSRFCASAVVAVSILALSATASYSERQWAPITAAETALIADVLSRKMLDPESTRVANLMAATDDKEPSLIYVCGEVQGKNTLGGYAQPVMFLGALVTNNVGKRVFTVIAIAKTSGFNAVAQQCISLMPSE